MEPKLLTFEECCKNVDLFEAFIWNSSMNGRFFNLDAHGKKIQHFVWLYDGKLHRADGPASIYGDIRSWWFLNERVNTDSQDGFDAWVIRRM